MISTLDILEAEHQAERVLRDYQFTDLPICPFTIAEKAGIVVKPKDSTEPGVSGFLMRVGDTFGIQYARHIASEGFIRFTIAHELGHYFLPKHAEKLFPNGTDTHQSRSGFVSGDPLERQADHFASALLMPKTLFRRALNRAGQGFSAIEQLATLCKTSITATAIRFANFTDDAVAIVMSAGNQIDYCFMSERIKELRGVTSLKKGDVLPRRSATAAFNNEPSNVRDAGKVEGASYLDDWFDGGPQVEMCEDVIGLGSYGKTLTVLFTDEDLEEDAHEDDDD